MDSLRLDFTVAVRGFDLELALDVGRETFALVGPSGAGKSTALRAIAGLIRPRRGSIALGSETWFDAGRGVDVPPERRSVGLVFQEYALFPHLSVADNVAYGANGEVGGLLERLGVASLARERPSSLSGGELQRVALARALARDPAVLLLDEPLGALDALTRDRVRSQLRTHLGEAALPTLLVTHDFTDAAALADRVGVLVDGAIVQTGTAGELIAAPATAFVAELAGTNFVAGTATPRADDLSSVALGGGLEIVSSDRAQGAVHVLIHPWDISIARAVPADSMQNHIRGRITSFVPIGNRVRLRVGPLTAEITGASAEQLSLAEGDEVVASFKATAARILPA